MGIVVNMSTVKPKEIVSRLGRHTLVLTYCPDNAFDHRWRWMLRVVQHLEYCGTAGSPAECKLAAELYAGMHP